MLKIIAIAILAILASPCFADTLEISHADKNTQFQLYVQRPIAGNVGAYAYSCQTKSFGETHTGLTYALASYIQLSAGIGVDTSGTRIAGSVWAGKDKVSGIYFLESGRGGTWDKLVLKYQATEKIALGYTKKQFVGEGLYAEFKLSKEATVKYSGFKTPELALQLSF